MAVRFNNTISAYLQRSSGPTNTSFTACWWVYLVSDSDGYGAFFGQNNASVIQVYSDGTTLSLGTTTNDYNGSTLTIGVWTFVSWTRSGSSHNVYRNGSGSAEISATDSASSTTWNVGTWNSGNFCPSARIAHLKVWDATILTTAQMAQEMWSARPRNWSGLWAWYPFIGSMTADFGESARNWTQSGTLALEDGPPVPWGASPMLQGPAEGGTISVPGYYL